MYDLSFQMNDDYMSSSRVYEKPKSLEDPMEENYNVEQIRRLVNFYNNYLEDDSQLNVDIKIGKFSKKLGKEIIHYSLYNMKCSMVSDSTKRNVWIIKTDDNPEIFKNTFEQCLRYLIKYWYVIPRSDIRNMMLAKQ